MFRFFIFSVLVLAATPAVAQNSPSVAKEIRGFRTVNVLLTGKTKDCYITETDVFVKRASDKLGEIGIKQNPESIVNVDLNVVAQPFGVLNQVCAYSVSMDLTTRLSSQNLVTDSPQVRAAIDRLKNFPVGLWSASAFGVATLTEKANISKGQRSTEAEKGALEAVDVLVNELAEYRK